MEVSVHRESSSRYGGNGAVDVGEEGKMLFLFLGVGLCI